MNIKSVEDVRSATTKELLEFFNARNGEATLARFSSRKAGENKVIAILEHQKAAHSEAVANTWKDPAVAEARAIKDGVLVAWNGHSSSFKSTRQAFVALDLPMAKCIRFRAQLKAKSKATFTQDGVDYKFFIDNDHGNDTSH